MNKLRFIYSFIPRKYVKNTEYVLKGFLFPKILSNNNQAPRILINSFPKAGTNLLITFFKNVHLFNPKLFYHIDPNVSLRTLDVLLKNQKPGQIISSHMGYDKELSEKLMDIGIKNIFIIRDLRDIAVSNFYYITYKDRYHRMHNFYKNLSDDSERLLKSIKNDEYGITIRDHATKFMGWLSDKNCLVIKFENLIGKAGGGTDSTQDMTISKIYDFLQIDYDVEEINKLKNNLFNKNSRTFRKGQIGEWKNHFTEKHKDLFKEVAGKYLIELGYEEDNNW